MSSSNRGKASMSEMNVKKTDDTKKKEKRRKIVKIVWRDVDLIEFSADTENKQQQQIMNWDEGK